MKFSQDHYQIIQSRFLRLFPENFPLDLIEDYKSILSYKEYLKSCKPNKQILNVLLDVTLNKINNGGRFQKLIILKLILNHLRQDEIDSAIKSKIFKIYQSLIFTEKDEVCWKLSNLLKDKSLEDGQIRRLLDHYELSEYILNRILRYPLKNKMISQWAETAINNEEMANRKSEIIGCILNYSTKYNHKDHRALAWGIYYSKLDDMKKRELLEKHLHPDNLEDILEICERKNFIDLISNLYDKLN